MSLYIPVLLGSARDIRVSDKAAHYVAQILAKRPDVKTEVADCRELLKGMSHEDLDCAPWSEMMERADALIIVSPEYNHGYPAPLKAVLDGGENYDQKPVAICGTSSGGLGGPRMVEQLRLVMIELGMLPINSAVYFSSHKKLWNEDGSITDSAYEKRINVLLDELLWYTEGLKEWRTKNPFPEQE